MGQANERAKKNRQAVARWKLKNHDRVLEQKARARQRKATERALEKRRMDPTGELCYEPLNGVDTAPSESNQPDSHTDPDHSDRDRSGAYPAGGTAERLHPLDHEEILRDAGNVDQTQTGIIEPPEFTIEAKRLSDFHKLKTLHSLRAKLEAE